MDRRTFSGRDVVKVLVNVGGFEWRRTAGDHAQLYYEHPTPERIHEVGLRFDRVLYESCTSSDLVRCRLDQRADTTCFDNVGWYDERVVTSGLDPNTSLQSMKSIMRS